MRAWLVAEANSRVTLTRADVANAIQRSDQFDFLVDIVPREDASLPMRPPKKPKKKESIDSTTPMPSYSMMDVGLPPMTGNDQVSMQEAMAAADELMAIAESQGGGTRMVRRFRALSTAEENEAHRPTKRLGARRPCRPSTCPSRACVSLLLTQLRSLT